MEGPGIGEGECPKDPAPAVALLLRSSLPHMAMITFVKGKEQSWESRNHVRLGTG